MACNMTPLFTFSVVKSGLACIASLDFVSGKFYLYKKIEGSYLPYAEDGKVLYLGDKNTCVSINHSGDYAVGDISGVCDNTELPSFNYEESADKSFLNAVPVCLWDGDIISPRVSGFCIAQFDVESQSLEVIKFFEDGSVAPSNYRIVPCC